MIDLIFQEFLQNFRDFFSPLDRGFVNEAIIQLYARKYEISGESKLRLERPQYKMTQLYFIISGGFALYYPKIKEKGEHENNNPFLIMKRYNVYGDYQMIHSLYPMVEFCPYCPDNNTPEVVI